MSSVSEHLTQRLTVSLGDASERAAAIALLTRHDTADTLLGWPEMEGEDADRLALLEAYQSLTREVSTVLHQRAVGAGGSLLSSVFADLAVAALLREAYLDVQTAVALLGRGFDVQAAVILRHLWELDLRALVVAADPQAADEFEKATLATLEGEASAKRLERLRERAWSRALSPAELMRRAARIEASTDITIESVGSSEIDDRITEMRAVYFGFLSDLAHGGSQMLIKSAMRSDEDTAPYDPIAALGRPSDWCSDLLAHALWLQARLWHVFVPAGLPLAHPNLTEHERTTIVAAVALDATVQRDYSSLLWSGIEWADDDRPS